jgi:hypothetical protein
MNDVEEVVGKFYKLPPGRRSEMSKQIIETKKRDKETCERCSDVDK